MHVIDITRPFSNDILVGNDSMSAKSKTLDYVIDYAFANHNISIDRNLLDQCLNIDFFSLKDFLNKYYPISIERDLIIQSIITDKDNCIFVKYMDDETKIPLIRSFNKKDINIAHNILTYLVNDGLIKKYKDNLSEYYNKKLDYSNKIFSTTRLKDNIKCDIISLYNRKGLFLEQLLNNNCSLNQLENNYLEGIHI